MFPKPRQDLRPNTAEFERLPFVKATGFREYDARWRYPEEINLLGLEAVGLALVDLMRVRGVPLRIVVGHDYRSYSASIKAALINGLLAGGAEVHDIGLALSPMAYFAQFELGVEGVAMVTASHNDNGWTGIKMGIERPLTFAPEDMTALKERVLEGGLAARGGGSYIFVPDIPERYMADLLKRPKLIRPLKAVVSCGNGTAGAFAPRVLAELGVTVVPLNCELDYTFPAHNPNPEDLAMLDATRDLRRQGRRDAGPRHRRAQQRRAVRRRCEIHGPVPHRSRLARAWRQDAVLEDWPFLHQALQPRDRRAGRLREVGALLLQPATRPRL
jgi:phosphomannomutase/phosphoglucomutase